jgi:hypothetical protein
MPIGAFFVAVVAALQPAAGAPPWESITPERLLETIRALPTKRSPLGTDEHRRGLRDTEELLRTRLKDLGLEPVTQDVPWAIPIRPDSTGDSSRPEPHVWRNIIVELRGTELANEILVLGAHFDAVPRTPGADDNGTGTAALLEIARVLKDQPRRRTLHLVFFNLEEVGLVGSKRYVAERLPPRGAPRKIVGMVSLEMLGYFTDAPDSQQSPIPPVEGVFEPPTVGDGIAVVGLARGRGFSQRLIAEMGRVEPELKITAADFLPLPIPDLMRSDHAPFLTAGIPAVMMTDTANFRNPNYHQPTDTIDTIDPKRYAMVVRAVAGAVHAMLNGDGWPLELQAPTPSPGETAPVGQ